MVTKPDSAPITPRFRRFLSADLTGWFNVLLAENRQWTFAGCDQVTSRAIVYLGSQIAYLCHARSARPTGGGAAISVLYTANWRAAGVEGYGF